MAAKGRAGAEGDVGTCPGSNRLQEVVWGSLQELASCSDPEGTLLSWLPLHREMPPPHHEAQLCNDAFSVSPSPPQPAVAWLKGVLCQCLELRGWRSQGSAPRASQGGG